MIGTLTILAGIAFCASTIGVFSSINSGNQPMLYVNFIMWIFLFAILIFLVRYILSLISTIKQATYIPEQINNLNQNNKEIENDFNYMIKKWNSEYSVLEGSDGINLYLSNHENPDFLPDFSPKTRTVVDEEYKTIIPVTPKNREVLDNKLAKYNWNKNRIEYLQREIEKAKTAKYLLAWQKA